ncbi:hypothetical protein C4D60_Mb03t16240 [Musa balbisiana]|uniref:Uncharacterized protein n=1 Tax=Musa balbisiana TaxID=52838 RepID=A0A4V4H657_MUSBA|nr:hypothetical protein C4D60_Mb03t16240 [Musa balbisiana]
MMASVITASSGSMYLVRSKIITHCSCRTFDHHGFYPSSKYHLRRQPIRHSIMKLQAAGKFAEPNKATSYFKDLADRIWEASPKLLKEFPWEEAKDMVVRQLFFLGKKALRWSFIVLYAISFLSDISLAISRDRELLVPIGLFVGVALADFIKESLQEFLKSRIEDGDPNTYLLGIGSFFVFVSLCFKLQGKVLLSHIGNGGLMQVLWLARKLQQTDDIKNQNALSTDASSVVGEKVAADS